MIRLKMYQTSRMPERKRFDGRPNKINGGADVAHFFYIRQGRVVDGYK